MLRTAATGLLAAAVVVGLSACGTLDGSAHAAPSPVSAVSATPTATATPAATAPATADPAAPAEPAANPPPAGGAATDPGPGTGGAPPPAPTGPSGGTGQPGSTAPGGSAPGPKVTSLHVATKPNCAAHGTSAAPFSSVTIAWSVTGASGAALAVDQPGSYGAYGSDYPASGTLELPFSCAPGTKHSYTIWPAGNHGVSKTITVSAPSGDSPHA